MFARLVIAFALVAYCALCAAAISGYDLSSVMNGILKVETGGQQYAINDNTTRRSYHYSTKDEAVNMANYLISLNHNIDMGKYQVNSIQLSRGWSVSSLFDASFNQTAAETIFNEWLAKAIKLFGDTELAWQRAIGGYNAGSAGLRNGNPSYTTKVLRAMGIGSPPLDRGEPGMKASSPEMAQAKLPDDDTDDQEQDSVLPSKRQLSGVEANIVDSVAITALLALLALAAKILGPFAMRLFFRIMYKIATSAVRRAKKIAESGGPSD